MIIKLIVRLILKTLGLLGCVDYIKAFRTVYIWKPREAYKLPHGTSHTTLHCTHEKKSYFKTIFHHTSLWSVSVFFIFFTLILFPLFKVCLIMERSRCEVKCCVWKKRIPEGKTTAGRIWRRAAGLAPYWGQIRSRVSCCVKCRPLTRSSGCVEFTTLTRSTGVASYHDHPSRWQLQRMWGEPGCSALVMCTQRNHSDINLLVESSQTTGFSAHPTRPTTPSSAGGEQSDDWFSTHSTRPPTPSVRRLVSAPIPLAPPHHPPPRILIKFQSQSPSFNISVQRWQNVYGISDVIVSEQIQTVIVEFICETKIIFKLLLQKIQCHSNGLMTCGSICSTCYACVP